MKVEVTQTHIKNGRRYITDKCPIALALCDAGLHGVAVETDYVEADELEELVALPDEAREFVNAYDNHDPVKPFIFDLAVEGVVHV